MQNYQISHGSIYGEGIVFFYVGSYTPNARGWGPNTLQFLGSFLFMRTLEQSSAVCHIRAVTSRLLHSLEDILLRIVLFIKLLLCLWSDIVILDTLIVLLTYLSFVA